MSAIRTTTGLRDKRVREWEPFTETLDFFNNELQPWNIVLAGGCIRDLWIEGPELIKDYDMWVLGVEESEVPSLDALVTRTIDNLSEHDEVEELVLDYPNRHRDFHVPKKNLRLPWIPGGKSAQLIYTPEPTMQDLIARFDWRVCSFAFDGETVISEGVADFDEKTLTLNPDNALRSARQTLRRGFHLEDKFRGTAHRLRMLNETILALAAMLTLSGEKQPEA